MARGIVELRGEHIEFRVEGGKERSFAFADAAEKLSAWSTRYDLALNSARDDGPLIAIGAEIFTWLDDTGVATEWANLAGDRELEIRALGDGRVEETVLLDAPWELLVGPSGPFAFDEDRLFIVARRIGRKESPWEAKRGELGLMFMAAAPEGASSLDFEAEEAGILEATKTLAMRLVVEESGALPFLEAQLASNEGPFEALHLSCHGDITDRGPVLLLEAPEGGAAPATPDALIKAVGGEKPPLVVLSACRTAEFGRATKVLGSVGQSDDEARHEVDIASAPDVAAPLARRLVAQVSNVVGWDGSVYDADATEFARHFYARLAALHDVPDAAAFARLAVARKARAQGRIFSHWHLARVYLGPTGGGPLIARGKPKRPTLASRAFLDKRGEVPVATRAEFVGRRRASQAVLRAFREGTDGVLIHGMGALGKSSLAARVASRLTSHEPVVVFARYDAVAILDAVAEALPASVRTAEKAQWRELVREDAANLALALETWFEGPFAEKPILLVIDDLERILDTPKPGGGKTGVKADYRAALGAVLRVFARKTPTSRLLLTSRYDFRLVDKSGEDLAAGLVRAPLRPMDPGERDKQWRAAERAAGREGAEPKGEAKPLLDQALAAASGNPGLQAVLTRPILAGDLDTAKSALARIEEYLQSGVPPETLDALVAAGEAGDAANAMTLFFKRLSFSTYAQALDEAEERQLSASCFFTAEVPIPCAAHAAVGAALGVVDPEKAIARLIGLGLIDDWGEIGGAPHAAANPLARPLAARLDEADTSRLAAAATPALVEAWRDAEGRFPFDLRGVEAARLALAGSAAPEVIEAAALAGGGWLARGLDDRKTAGPLVAAAFAALPREYASGAKFVRLACECADRLGDGELLAKLMIAPLRPVAEIDLEGQGDRALLETRFARYRWRAGDAQAGEQLARAAASTLKALCEDRAAAVAFGQVAEILAQRGDLDGALRIREQDQLPVYERLGDIRERAVTMGRIADILQFRGDLNEALRIRREEELPVYERLGEVRLRALTMCQIAEISRLRGDLDGALQVYKDQLPVYKRLGDAREHAVTMGRIADILQSRDDLDDALQIHTDQLRVYERLGDVRSHAVVMGRIAEILQSRGDLDGALQIHEGQLPVYERFRDTHGRAVTMGKIAEILQSRGDLDGALRIYREEQLPVYERLRDVRSQMVTMGKIAEIMQAKGDLAGALQIQRDRLPICEVLGDLDSKAHALSRVGEILLQSNGVAEGRGQEIADALSKSFAIYTQLGTPNQIGRVGSTYAQVLAMAGYRDQALAVLDRAEAAYAKLQRPSGIDRVRELRDRIRKMPVRDDPPPADA